MKGTILIIAAHSDDQIIGPGGTVAKYAKEGCTVKTIVFSKGEISHPHFQEKIIVSTREKESIRADKIIGGKGVKFLGVLEKDFNKEKIVNKAKKEIERIVNKLQPKRILTHSPEDPHPTHRKVARTVLEAIEKQKRNIEVYAFEIWNPFKWDKKKDLQLVVDISETFDKKMKALKCFKSQFNIIAFLNYFALANMYIKNRMNGLKHKTLYVEVFYKIK